MARIVMRKLRTGNWTATGSGNGSTGSGSEGQESEEDEDDEGDDDEEEGDDDGEDKAKGKKKDDPGAVKRLSDEAARRRKQARDNRLRAEKAERELQELKDKDTPEKERMAKEIKDQKEALEKTQAKSLARAMRAAIANAVIKLKINDAKYAAFLLKESGKVDPEGLEDEELDAEVEAALAQIIKDTPHLVTKSKKKSSGDDEEDSEDDEEDDETRRVPQGRTSPKFNNGKGKTRETEEQRRARLAAKYPALQG